MALLTEQCPGIRLTHSISVLLCPAALERQKFEVLLCSVSLEGQKFEDSGCIFTIFQFQHNQTLLN